MSQRAQPRFRLHIPGQILDPLNAAGTDTPDSLLWLENTRGVSAALGRNDTVQCDKS